jgi:hypothetical protein
MLMKGTLGGGSALAVRAGLLLSVLAASAVGCTPSSEGAPSYTASAVASFHRASDPEVRDVTRTAIGPTWLMTVTWRAREPADN